MSPDRAHDVVFNDADDDDGMPPLVDNPLPPMTYTFMADTSHHIWHNETVSYEHTGEAAPAAAEMSMFSPPGSPTFAPARPSHAKKRDASYIPRPPNAFILFRSSFIRAQHIPGQIEGNHSALSKIIGKYWKALAPDERKVWEAKAVAALAEHRKKYPDWRFRPAANALAKVKDGPRRRGSRRGRGQSETEERSREKRCAKIADLLVAGKTGTDLAAAIQQYDCEVDRGRKPKEELPGEAVAQMQVQVQVQGQGERRVGVEKDVKVHAGGTLHESRAASIPNAAECADAKSVGTRSSGDGRFKVPLTAMFKRSSSAPAPRARVPSPDMQQIAAPRRESVCAAPPYFARASSFSFGSFAADLRGEAARPSIDGCSAPRDALQQDTGDSVSSTSSPAAPFSARPFVFPSDAANRGVGGAVSVNDPYALNVPGSTCSSPPLPAMDSDADGIDTPALSPVTTPPASAFGWPYSNESDIGSPTSISDLMGEAYAPAPSPSSYSSLEGWAGSPQAYHAQSVASPILPAYPKMFDYVDGQEEERGVMEKAFDAASCAAFGDAGWRDPFGVVNVVGAGHASPSPYVWAAEAEASWGYHTLVGGYCRQGHGDF